LSLVQLPFVTGEASGDAEDIFAEE
jgi:hypothetical protein